MSVDAIQARISELVDDCIRTCTLDLFQDHYLKVALLESRPSSRIEPASLVGVVGFLGDVSGTLLLAAASELLSHSHPLHRERDVSEQMLFDWAGELANQLAGRLKLRLAEHDVDLRLTAPVSITADRVRFIRASGETGRVGFGRGTHTISVWVDATLRQAFRGSEALFAERVQRPSTEGTITFF